MKVVVFAKQIQDPEIASSVFNIDEAANMVVPIPGMAPVTSPFDEQALEAALRIKDSVPDVSIVLVTIGPPSARDVLKHGLSMGADEGILVVVPNVMDSFETATTLCRVVSKLGPVDLILAGRQAADLDAGVVGCGVAELLGIPAITFAKDVRTSDGRVTVERALDGGVEIVEASLPALVTVSNELGAARKPTLRETMRASRKPVSSRPIAEVVEESLGPKQEVIRLYKPVKEKRCVFVAGSVEEIAASLVQKLHEATLV